MLPRRACQLQSPLQENGRKSGLAGAQQRNSFASPRTRTPPDRGGAATSRRHHDLLVLFVQPLALAGVLAANWALANSASDNDFTFPPRVSTKRLPSAPSFS